MFPHLIKHHLNNSSQQEDDENYCNKDDIRLIMSMTDSQDVVQD